MSAPLLSLRDVTYAYRSRRRDAPVLQGIDLDVEAGAFVTVVGPSGSGKSTLLHVMGLLHPPTSGRVVLDGRDATAMRERDRRALARGAVAFVFQAYHLLDDLTVAENVAEPLRYQKVPAAERQERVADVLDRFDLAARADRTPTELSGGQQQLVGVARALAARPRLLLADEPTGSLHSSQGAAAVDALREANERDGVTVVHVTHSERWAAGSDRVVELLDGRVVADSETGAD
jgi:ABC-type lipoprotein export system ATPase subunit